MEGNIAATVTPNALRVQQGDVELVMRLIDGEFPNYEQVIPKATKSKIVVDKNELLSALRRVSVVASDRARGVKLHIAEGQLTISASSPDFGEASEEIEVAYGGEPLSVGFNSRYLTDVLAVLPEEHAGRDRAHRRREPRRDPRGRRRVLQLRRHADAALIRSAALRARSQAGNVRHGCGWIGPDPAGFSGWLSEPTRGLQQSFRHLSRRAFVC